MSHRRTVIEPAEGLTVLVGPNNCGKSAVVVALQCMNTCDNRSAPFVRHGQKEARVVVDTSEGSRVEWIRGKNYTNYKINGREMTRARRPEDLDDHLRLAQVESEDGKRTFDLHFAEQKNPIFLLNESGAAAATFFAASSDAAYLVQMQSLLKRKESEARTRRRDLEARIDRQRKQLDAFETLANIEAEAKQAQDSFAELARLRDTLVELKRLNFAIEDASTESEACRADLDALHAVSPPPEVAPTLELGRYVIDLSRIEESSALARDRSSALEEMTLPPEVPETTVLASTIDLLTRKHRSFRKITEKTRISEGASPPPEIDSGNDLCAIVEAMEAHEGRVRKAMDALQETTDSLNRMRADLDRYLDKNPTCPVCGSKLTADALLAHSDPHV